MLYRLLRGIVLRVYYPFLMFLGAFLKGKKEGFQKSVINFNNRLVMAEKPKAKKILLLLPHCIQVNECNIRLTHNIYNCERCGRCEIKDLIEIAEENRLELFVATGGAIARKIVKEVKPEAIVAVACERDLSSGLADAYPFPILGIPNERPYGPCLNTRVDLDKVKEAIHFFGRD
ncbi:MAG: hypothetical protein CVV37_03200 [Nitrospira bacterium HGW-Nitrospira-1]|nr:MAG: hypothetical protein CVV37_03200 [Nitrospira bacterium HGW-Nitrospira-1]